MFYGQLGNPHVTVLVPERSYGDLPDKTKCKAM